MIEIIQLVLVIIIPLVTIGAMASFSNGLRRRYGDQTMDTVRSVSLLLFLGYVAGGICVAIWMYTF